MHLHEDILCYTFSFLDYSHTSYLSLVCKEWNRIANSNPLWETYFHQLTNNSLQKSNLHNDNLYWKHKIRDQYSKYNMFLSQNSQPSKELELEFKQTFPNAFSSQLVKIILSRIIFTEIILSFNDVPFYKMKLLIDGIEEPIIVRGKNIPKIRSGYGKSVASDYFLYVARESDDLTNAEFFYGSAGGLRNELSNRLEETNQSFLYKFIDRNSGGRMSGVEYLEKHILSYLIPTVKSYELSPKQFIPYFCLLINIRILKFRLNNSFHYINSATHRFFANYFPNFIRNNLVYHFLKKHYLEKVKEISKELSDQFKSFTPKDTKERDVFTSFILKKDLKPLKKGHNQRLDLINLGLTIQKYSKLFANLRESGTDDKMNAKSREKYISKIQQLCSNEDEFVEYYLRYKYTKFNLEQIL